MFQISLRGVQVTIEGCPESGLTAVDFRRAHGLLEKPSNIEVLPDVDIVSEELCRRWTDRLDNSANLIVDGHPGGWQSWYGNAHLNHSTLAASMGEIGYATRHAVRPAVLVDFLRSPNEIEPLHHLLLELAEDRVGAAAAAKHQAEVVEQERKRQAAADELLALTPEQALVDATCRQEDGTLELNLNHRYRDLLAKRDRAHSGEGYPFHTDLDRLQPLVASIRHRVKEHNASIAAQKAAEEEARARAKAAQIAAWVQAHGTDGQKARHAEGLLPEEEVVNALRAAAFAPLDGFPRYQRIEASEVCECEHEEWDDDPTPCKIDCETLEPEGVTDEQYAKLVEFRRLMPGATVEPRLHSCTGRECEKTVERLSLHVTATVGVFTFTREYAL